MSKIVRLFNDYDQKQQTLDICLSNKLDRLYIQCLSNDITDENRGRRFQIKITIKIVLMFIENWNGICGRLIELIEANDLAQMNTIDLQTYSKLILELDSTIASFKRTIAK